MDTSFVQSDSSGQVRHPLDKPVGEAARDAKLEQQLDRLHELADMGLELGRGLIRRAARLESEEGPGYEAVCLAFTRVNRAIRQINVQEQEILGLRETAQREARQARAEAEEKAADERKAAGRRQVFRTVRDLLEADPDLDAGEINSEIDDLRQRFDHDYDDLDDLYQGSHDEIVARICRDMGIEEPGLGEESNEETESADGGKPVADERQLTPGEAAQRVYFARARIKGTGPP